MIKEIEGFINEILSCNDIENITVSKSSRPDLCDFQCNDVFKLAKKLQVNPNVIGDKIVSLINASDDFSKYFKEVCFVMPGFINITVSDSFISKHIRLMNNDLFNLNKSNLTYVIDYGGPNIAKPLHVGHMRTARRTDGPYWL